MPTDLNDAFLVIAYLTDKPKAGEDSLRASSQIHLEAKVAKMVDQSHTEDS